MTLPNGSVVLHIGPHKTGTTAIQAALWAARERLTDQGVLYPGQVAHEMAPAMAVALGRVDPGKDRDHHAAHWHEMVRDMHARRPRIGVLSSEFYCEADEERRRQVLDALGPAVHVVVTVRPIVRLIGSQWQQYCQNRITTPYDVWLRNVLDHPEGSSTTPSFWRRHRHDLLVERWAADVGPENLTVVVVDDREPLGLLTSFEDLLGLTPGTLEPPQERSNRSLTFDETSLMLAFNRRSGKGTWAPADYDRFIRFGAARGVQARPADPRDQPILTPQWAVDRALEIGATMADGIRATGVTVVGSLDILRDPGTAPRVGENTPVTAVRPDVLAGFSAGLVNRMARIAGGRRPRDGCGPVERAVWSRHRSVRQLRNPDRVTALQRELAEVEQRIRQHRPADEASAVDRLRELAARARHRVGRRLRPRPGTADRGRGQ